MNINTESPVDAQVMVGLIRSVVIKKGTWGYRDKAGSQQGQGKLRGGKS